MNKQPSVAAHYFISILMMFAALIYTLVIHSVVNTTQMDSLHKFYWYIPSIFLILSSIAIDIFATILALPSNR